MNSLHKLAPQIPVKILRSAQYLNHFYGDEITGYRVITEEGQHPDYIDFEYLFNSKQYPRDEPYWVGAESAGYPQDNRWPFTEEEVRALFQ